MRTIASGLVAVATGVCLLAVIATVQAKPYVPADDAVVLERLPERNDPALAELKRLRKMLAANPRDVEVATRVARRSVEAARATGDPRFLGQAQGALGPWWMQTAPPAGVQVLRATIKQSQHDFDGALTDLDSLLRVSPRDAQALLTRATVLTVLGRYSEAQRDCAQLFSLASALVTTTCLAGATSLSGGAVGAYEGLVRGLARPGEAPGVRTWALTLAGEIAQRRGDASLAQQHFRQALELDPHDAYLRAAYADFLLASDRAEEVIALVGADTSNDALFLRLVLAEQTLPARAAAYRQHRDELGQRFAAARQRGDTLHLREEARYYLKIERNSGRALEAAKANWQKQREPADLAILAAAAQAANDAQTRKVVTDWIATTKLEDAGIIAVLGGKAS